MISIEITPPYTNGSIVILSALSTYASVYAAYYSCVSSYKTGIYIATLYKNAQEIKKYHKSIRTARIIATTVSLLLVPMWCILFAAATNNKLLQRFITNILEFLGVL